MKSACALSNSITVSAMLSFTIVLISGSAVSAQTGSRPPAPTGNARPNPGGPRRPEGQPPPSIRERQFKMQEMEREAATPRTPEEQRLALTQIAEDFVRIQVINNKMMHATVSAAELDYGRIAETTAEIRKRAGRIKANLPLPEADAKDVTAKHLDYKKAVDAASMKSVLLSLDTSIMSFIKSAIFKNTDVIDVGEATRAKRDLDTIIELSNFISKDAEKLGQSAKKSRQAERAN